ncbi:hypothetical protein D1Y85_18000 [Paraburkholderia dinghuensis]|uniref:SMI1/KNR4 family protein n=2 Tax=Paraburkholderia dinghuensis TaxID=2305225 RepID=A0A3N6MLG4_9BURK|nr:hypothetical protein D1Y85_18000 [Paraburkholderia dinghuensis]
MKDPDPALRVKFHILGGIVEPPRLTPVQHVLWPIANERDKQAREASIEDLSNWPGATELVKFYSQYDGFFFCRAYDVRYDKALPLVDIFGATEIRELTRRYEPGGDRAYSIEHNKSNKIYRGGSGSWIVFGEIDGGPNALSLFLDGEFAGNVFLIQCQPRFNILKPIAKGFEALLQRMGKDPAAFLRLVGATVTLSGEEHWPGFDPGLPQYGFTPLDYLKSILAIEEPAGIG